MPHDDTDNEFEPDVRSIIDWNPNSTKRAETSADTGQLSTAADLCERILADDRGAGVLNQRATITRLPLTFEGGSPEAVNLLEKDDEFWRIIPAAQLQQFHKWFALMGIGLGRFSWATEDGKPRMRNGKHLPIAEAWSTPRHLERNTFTREWICEVGQRGDRQTVTPGENGWLLWTAASDRPWSQGAWRACRVWWLLKQYAVQDWARYGERVGQGILVETAPADQAETPAKRRKLANELKTLGTNGAIVLPPGFTIELVESTARSNDTFEKQVDAANSGLAIAILGQNLTSEVKSGARASAVVHEQVAQTIISTDAEALSDFVHNQILVPWAIANFGNPDAAPWPVWDSLPREDNSPRIKNWVELGQAIKQFREEGIPQDILAMAEQAGVPLLTGKKVQAPTTPPDKDDDDAKSDDDSDDSADAAQGAGESAPAAAKTRTKPHGCHPAQAAATKAGERDGQNYADRVADSMRLALGADLAPHLKRITEIVAAAGTDYARARFEIEEYYRDEMDPTIVSSLMRAGLTMQQLGGWAAVRKDAPELD